MARMTKAKTPASMTPLSGVKLNPRSVTWSSKKKNTPFSTAAK